MKEVSVSAAKTRFGILLDRVERGEEIVITRRGKPVVRLVRCPPPTSRDVAREAAQSIRAMSKGIRLGGLTVRGMIDEERR